jgi:hypothetical protein
VAVSIAGCATTARHSSPPSAASSPATVASSPAAPPASPERIETPPPELRVSELLDEGAELRPSAKALALAGARVKLVGFVAELEEPPEGVLFLTPLPVRCDEAGAGTADLPPGSVLVYGEALAGRRGQHVPGPVEAVGVLGVGSRTHASGHASSFQLALDTPSADDSRRVLHARRN